MYIIITSLLYTNKVYQNKKTQNKIPIYNKKIVTMKKTHHFATYESIQTACIIICTKGI